MSEGWHDCIIKKHAWFSSLRWDAVLLRQVRPSMVPDLKDSMDVSNFDVMFTSDKSWNHSALLRGSTNKDADDAEEHDPFADFHYVSRPLGPVTRMCSLTY